MPGEIDKRIKVGARDASEAHDDASIAQLIANKTLAVIAGLDPKQKQEFTATELRTLNAVFEHFKPEVDVELESVEGELKTEAFQFKNLKDFTPKQIKMNSEYLGEAQLEADSLFNFLKHLNSNKKLAKVLEDPEKKKALLEVLEVLIGDLKE